MAHSDDNQSQAAALLGISRHALRTQLANLASLKAAAVRSPLQRGGQKVSRDRELRIGFQRFGNLGILKARQSLEQAFASRGVSVLWSEFPAGPQLLHALACDEIDFGTTGEAPPVFAQAITASWSTSPGNRPRRKAWRWSSRSTATFAPLPTCAASVSR
jgi:ABC-type nitrate/sulfonate/bicarbonate transport system substrate-binding protein